MIKTAIILSARRERDCKIPYPLIPFDGSQNLLERNLYILKNLGFEKIILIVGYCKEQFHKYSNLGVKIIENPDYRYTGSMASLSVAAPYIEEDFLLIESDVICEKSIFEALRDSDKRNCLTIVDESGSGDEALVEFDNDIILKITKDKHQLNRIDGEMIGVSRISYDIFRRMMLRWEYNTNPMLNYEYLFLDTTEKHERKYIKHNNVIWCDVDNALDFDRLKNDIYPKLRRKENPFDSQNIIDTLCLILGEKMRSSIDKIEFIGGMTNRNFKIITDTESYVLRIPGNGTDGLIERINEGKNSLLSNRINISPKIKYIDNKTGIKLTQFIADAETLNKATIQRFENLKQITQILKVLHNSAVRQNNDFNVFHEILKYENIINELKAKMYDGYDSVRTEIFELEDRLNKIGIQIKPCHNDLVAENFIKDKTGKIYLIDWEYSGMNDPMWDLGALFLESQFDEDSQSYTLQQYFGEEEISSNIWVKIKIYQILADTLWSLWTVIKESQGDNFGDYGITRWKRALNNLRNLTKVNE